MKLMFEFIDKAADGPDRRDISCLFRIDKHAR